MSDVVIVGGGPSGLTAATALAQGGVSVTVLERETAAGGIPRHSDHLGYGLRDLHRVMSGPAYARRLVDTAVAAGATIRTSSTVTGWTGDGALEVTAPSGRSVLSAGAIVLATGARERPRAARLVPGDRPAGVYTTGQLQNLVHLQHGVPGGRAVIVGAELVSWSAVLTLREGGCRTVAMISKHEKAESYAAFSAFGRGVLRVPVATRTRVVAVRGRRRVESVEVEDLDTGARRSIECDTVVFTGDWIPDNELARSARLDFDAAMRGPVVDTGLRTSRNGLFAIGNLVHPVETADLAALDGRHVRDAVLAHLGGTAAPSDGVRLQVEAPLRWISPGILRPGETPSMQHLVLWTDEFVRSPRVTITQQGKVIARVRTPWPASPGRAFHLPARWLRRLDSRADVTVRLD